MVRVSLPARVRLSRLREAPSPAVLTALRRLHDAPLLARIGDHDVVCVVVIAGGKVIGYLARGGEEDVLALEPSWRGRGIEAALHGEARTP